MKKSVCFVDDDQDEIRRFRDCMGDRYIVGAGVTLDQAIKELRENRVPKPDLVLLDLYYGKLTDDETRAELMAADEELSKMETKVRALLLKAGQSPEQGFELAEEVQKRFPGVPRVFFSRKAFLDDALRAQKKGLPLLEKPDPDPNEKGATVSKKYDEAMRRKANQIAIFLDGVINLNTWWVRKRPVIQGFVSGYFFFLVKIGLDLWKTNTRGLAGLIWAMSAGLLIYVFLGKRS
jgi:CheY-like chemotaxis protein